MNILEKLNELYKGNSYFEKYGVSVFLTIFILSIVAVAVVYINVYARLNDLKRSFKEEDRCKPFYMGIYGHLKDPTPQKKDDGTMETKDEAISRLNKENFNSCFKDHLQSNIDILSQPIKSGSHMIAASLKQKEDGISFWESFREEVEQIITSILNYFIAMLKNIAYGIATSAIYVNSSLAQGMAATFVGAKYNRVIYEGIIMRAFLLIYNKIQIILDIFNIIIAVLTSLIIIFIIYSLLWFPGWLIVMYVTIIYIFVFIFWLLLTLRHATIYNQAQARLHKPRPKPDPTEVATRLGISNESAENLETQYTEMLKRRSNVT